MDKNTQITLIAALIVGAIISIVWILRSHIRIFDLKIPGWGRGRLSTKSSQDEVSSRANLSNAEFKKDNTVAVGERSALDARGMRADTGNRINIGSMNTPKPD